MWLELPADLFLLWTWLSWVALLLGLLSIPSVLVRRRGRPLAALSWILALVSIPAVGLVAWWLIGRSHLERKRRRKRRMSAAMSQRFETLHELLDEPPCDRPTLLPLLRLPDELADSVFRPTTGNRVELLRDGPIAFEAMEQAIARARHHIHALFYIWNDDETGRHFRDLLADKARDGVQVRVLCDAVGARILGRRLSAPLREAGAQIACFNAPRWLSRRPGLNFRNHRKILVVDDEEGFVGGFNIGDEYRRDWRDRGVRLEGPAVDQLQEIFADDWYFATTENLADEEHFGKWTAVRSAEPGCNEIDAACAVVASGPDTRHNAMHDMLFVAINRTVERLWIATPYFIPSPAIMAALRAAVYRHVDVRLLLPGKSDIPLARRAARSYYPELLDVGVRIFEYQPTVLHAKSALFDDDLALIGSANLDHRSFRLNFEVSCFIGGPELNGALTELFLADQQQSVEADPIAMRRRPWHTKVVDGAAHLLSPLL